VFYEIRRYHVTPGKLDDLDDRFEKHAVGFFAKHEIQPVAFFKTYIGPSNNELVYILAWRDLEERERKWAAFSTDPDWLEVRRQTEKSGPLVERIETAVMSLTRYSPVPVGTATSGPVTQDAAAT